MTGHTEDDTLPEKVTPSSSAGGSNLSRVRAYNERLVLSIIRELPQSRAEIARRTNLSAQAITLITRALSAEGLISTGEPIKGKVGQPSIPLMLSPSGAFFMGLKVGRRSAELITMNFVGEIVQQSELHYRFPTPELVVGFLSVQIPKLIEELGSNAADRLHGLGIAMPFEIWNWSEKLNAPLDVIQAWRNFDFPSALEGITKLPVIIENDATAACGAELTFGCGQEHSDFAYFFIGYFIGGGLVLNGSVYRGKKGNAGAFGSLPVINQNTPEGISQLIDTASIHIFETEASLHTDMDADYIMHDATIWSSDSMLLEQWLQTLASTLSMAVVCVNSVVDVGVVVIDGGFPPSIRDRIVAMTQAEMAHVDSTGVEVPEIIAGTIGQGARALGAAHLPLFSRFLLDETVLTKTT